MPQPCNPPDPARSALCAAVIEFAPAMSRLADALRELLTSDVDPPVISDAPHLHVVAEPYQRRHHEMPWRPAWRSLYVEHHAAAMLVVAAGAALAAGLMAGLLA